MIRIAVTADSATPDFNEFAAPDTRNAVHVHGSRAGTVSLLDVHLASANYGAKSVLHGITFQVCSGDLIGLVGPNGSGKTTLLHCLTGYHPLSSGTVHLLGNDIVKMSRQAIAEKIAFMPQQTESVFSFTALEMVLMGRHPYAGVSAFDTVQDVRLAHDALARLEIEHLRDRIFGQLSGGEKQLVLLARTFVQAAAILILDEPLTGLDVRHQYQLMNAIKARTKNDVHAALATFHDLAVAARWCTTIILIREGRIIDSGPPLKVITEQNLAALYDVEATISTNAQGQLDIHVNGCL